MAKFPSPRKTEKIFQEIIETQDDLDIGLRLFNQKINAVVDDANEDGGVFSDLIEESVEKLNDAWLFRGEIATVTGRVYILDGDVIEELNKLGIVVQSDDTNDAPYVFVKDIKLCSYGIQDTHHGYSIIEGQRAAKIGYAFVLPESQSPTAELILYPGDESKHIYDTPTPEAIDAKLHRLWPEAMATVDEVIVSNEIEVQKLPRRLAFIARKLQHDLRESNEFRDWLGLYINDRLKMDKIWPYMLTIKDSFRFLDSEEEGKWAEIAIDSSRPITTHIRRPYFGFSQDEDTRLVDVFLNGKLPDGSNENDSVAIAVDVRNIPNIRGTRAYRSIVDYALKGAKRDVAAAVAFSDDHPIDSTDRVEPNLYLAETRYEHHSGDPDWVKEMQLLDSELKRCMKDIAPLCRRPYESFEQALGVSLAITRMMADRLIPAGIRNYILEFSGFNTFRPNTIQSNNAIANPGEFLLEIDLDDHIIPLQPGDSLHGQFHSFQGAVREVSDEYDEVLYYACPEMFFNLEGLDHTVTRHSSVPIISVHTQRRGYAFIDGSVDVTIPALSQYMKNKQTRLDVTKSYGRDPIVKKINKLFAAFHNENQGSYQELRNVDVLVQVARFLEKTDRSMGKPTLVALEALLMKKPIQVSYRSLDDEGSATVAKGIVEDVSMHVGNSNEAGPFITLVVHDGTYVSFKISSIKTLAF